MRDCAIAIVFNSDKTQILITQRRDVHMWVLPGGGIDHGESPENAVVREVFEETGLSVIIKRQVALYTPINRLASNTYVFECEIVSGTLTENDEVKQLGFFSLDNLPTPFFHIHHDWITDTLKRLPTIIYKPLSQITYLKLIQYFFFHPIQVIRMLLARLNRPINSK